MPIKQIDLDTSTSGKLRFDTDTLVIDETNNRVGIGTTSPDDLLHIGSSTSTESGLKLETNASGSNCNIRLTEAGDSGFRIQYNGTDNKLYIGGGVSGTFTPWLTAERDTGNVGIGTTSPAFLLDVHGASDPKIRVKESTNTVEGVLACESDRVNIGSTSNHELKFLVNNSAKMVIATDGDIGIGTTNPSSKLHIGSGNIRIDDGYWIGQGDYRFLFHNSYGIKHIVKEQVSAPSVGDGQVVFWIDTDASTNGDLMVTAGSNSSSSSFNLGSI